MSAQHNDLYEFEGFLLDARSRILLRDGAVVRLTPKAFDTLLVLVKRGTQLVDKEQLLKEVWPDTYVEEGNLSRNIHELRKALGDDSSEPRFIETIPKRGYRFVAKVNARALSTAPADIATLEANATVIEKHTFARVISEEVEETQPAQVALPADVPQVFPVPNREARRRKYATTAVVLGAVVLIGTTAVFLYLKFWREAGPVPSSLAPKSTLVRLTNNNGTDLLPVWSPDGTRIVFCSNRHGKNEIYVMNADGSNVKRLTHNMAVDDAPKWSPDGTKIVFDSDRDGNKEIYVMDADGSNQTRLTANDATDSGAAWSPNGDKIAFASNRENTGPFNYDIYVMNTDGSGLRRIVNDPEFDAEPRWSPDGSRILFVSGRTGNFDLFEISADGSNARNLTAGSHRADGASVWSPNGANIAFVSARDGNSEIYIMDADGANVMRVTNNSARDDRPSWSPDGSKLVFQTDRDGNWEIYVTSVEGELVQLTTDPADDLDPVWSPDGNRIAFSSNRASKQHIYIMDANASVLTQITRSAGHDTEPAWSPDGKRIVFTSSRDGNTEIYLINSDGSNETRLTFNTAIDRYPKWSSSGRIVFASNREGQEDLYAMDADASNITKLTTTGGAEPDYSPDRTRIAFMRYSEIERIPQIYIAKADGSDMKQIANNLSAMGEPCWSPDGAKILFVKIVDKMGARANIFQMNSDGTSIERLTAGPIGDQRPSISPDGSRLLFQSNRDGNYEIYMKNLR
jgi:Tol biopolymer transport system component/DNA-binding winged helix-turn-helix (wHTH) protein